jgi:hypothetical protein
MQEWQETGCNILFMTRHTLSVPHRERWRFSISEYPACFVCLRHNSCVLCAQCCQYLSIAHLSSALYFLCLACLHDSSCVLCAQSCQCLWLATGRWFSQGTLVSAHIVNTCWKPLYASIHSYQKVRHHPASQQLEVKTNRTSFFKRKLQRTSKYRIKNVKTNTNSTKCTTLTILLRNGDDLNIHKQHWRTQSSLQKIYRDLINRYEISISQITM